MTEELQRLKHIAVSAKMAWQFSQLSKEDASEAIIPYLNVFNSRGKEIAKKYNKRFYEMSVTRFLHTRVV